MNMMHTENVYHMEAMNGKKILEEKQRIIETPYYKKIKGMKNGKKYSFSLPKRVSFTKFSPRKIQRTLTPYYPKKKSMKMKKNARCRDTKKKIRKNRGGGGAVSVLTNVEELEAECKRILNEINTVNDLEIEYDKILEKYENRDSDQILITRIFFDKYIDMRNTAIKNSLRPPDSEIFEDLRDYIKQTPEISLTPRLNSRLEDYEEKYDYSKKNHKIK